MNGTPQLLWRNDHAHASDPRLRTTTGSPRPASDADPENGDAAQPREMRCNLDLVDACACKLASDSLGVAPRVPHPRVHGEGRVKQPGRTANVPHMRVTAVRLRVGEAPLGAGGKLTCTPH